MYRTKAAAGSRAAVRFGARVPGRRGRCRTARGRMRTGAAAGDGDLARRTLAGPARRPRHHAPGLSACERQQIRRESPGAGALYLARSDTAG